MTTCNQNFQMLAVLSGSDQLTDAEQASLAIHADSCSDCRQIISEISALAPHLTLATHARPHVPRGHEARFLARATREGVPLRAPAKALPVYALQFASLAVLLVCAASWSWTTRPSIEPASQVQKAPASGLARSVTSEPSPVHAHAVRRPKPAPLCTPLLLNASFRFTWPQPATTGVDRQPVFTRDLRHENLLVTKPTFVSQEIGFNHPSFPFKVDMASLIVQEPPKIHLGEVAITDLTFIPIHP